VTSGGGSKRGRRSGAAVPCSSARETGGEAVGRNEELIGDRFVRLVGEEERPEVGVDGEGGGQAEEQLRQGQDG
jgi:hypothetical protein